MRRSGDAYGVLPWILRAGVVHVNMCGEVRFGVVWCGVVGSHFLPPLAGARAVVRWAGRQAGMVASRPLLVSKAMDDVLLAWSLFAFREMPAISVGYLKLL